MSGLLASKSWVCADAICCVPQVVLLDFFCYCCINCQHIVPFLGKLEEKYKGQAFEVVGVHSAKVRHCNDSLYKNGMWRHTRAGPSYVFCLLVYSEMDRLHVFV